MLHVCANFASLMSCFPIFQMPVCMVSDFSNTVCMDLIKSIAFFKREVIARC